MSKVALTPVVLYSHALSLATPPVQAGAAREACEHFFRETLNPKLREMFVPEMSCLGRVPRVTACLDARPDVTVTCVNTFGPSQLVLTSARRPLRFHEARGGLTVSQVFLEEAQRSCNFLPKPLNRAFWVSRPWSLIALFSFPRLTWQSGSQPCRFEAFSFCIELRSLFCLFAPLDFTTFRACTGPFLFSLPRILRFFTSRFG